MDYKALIEKQRAALQEERVVPVPIEFGGETVVVEVVRLMPDDWQQLLADHPPRRTNQGDVNLGFDQDGVFRNYPKVRIDGEVLPVEDWSEMYGVMLAPARNLVGSSMYGVNHSEPMTKLIALGKAAAGQGSGSPANRESRRAASKAGSPRK